MASIDKLTAALTAFDTLDALVNAQGNYRPTIRPDGNDRRYEVLADAYDRAQSARGDQRRAWRGGCLSGHRFEPVAATSLRSTCPHGKVSNQCCGNPEWLQVVHAINGALDDANMQDLGILEPLDSFAQSGGRWFEEYPEYRIVLPTGGGRGARIIAMTERAAEALQAAVIEVTGRPGWEARA